MLTFQRRPAPVYFAVGCIFGAASAVASAADIIVITDREHPVQAGPAVQIIEIDEPARIVASELTAHLPSDPVQAEAVARERLEAGGMLLQRRLRLAYQGVVEAWRLGVTQIPAVVVDRRYVVYGEPDVNRALSLIEQYRSAHP